MTVKDTLKMSKQECALFKRLKRVEDINAYNKVVCEELTKELKLPQKIFTVKLNCASDNLPEQNIDYYMRMVSILKKCVEHPRGIKKIRSLYTRAKKNKVRPPTIFNATYYTTKVILDLLTTHQYLKKTDKGYYTSSKGKTLLDSKL